MQVWMSSAKLPDSGAKACFDGVTGGAAGDTSDAPPDPRRPGCMSLGPWPPAGDEGGGSPGILGGPTDPSPRLVARYPCAFGAAAGALSKVCGAAGRARALVLGRKVGSRAAGAPRRPRP